MAKGGEGSADNSKGRKTPNLTNCGNAGLEERGAAGESWMAEDVAKPQIRRTAETLPCGRGAGNREIKKSGMERERGEKKGATATSKEKNKQREIEKGEKKEKEIKSRMAPGRPGGENINFGKW